MGTDQQVIPPPPSGFSVEGTPAPANDTPSGAPEETSEASLPSSPATSAPVQNPDIPPPPLGFEVAPSSTPDQTSQPEEAGAGDSTIDKAWDFMQTPLTRYAGIPDYNPDHPGWARALERFATGFTSPLSLGLAIGTMGAGGFLESAGAATLREAGIAAGLSDAKIAEQILNVGKGAEAVAAGAKTGRSAEELVQAVGVDPNVYKEGLQTLYNAGLKNEDLLAGKMLQKGGSLLFRQFGVSPVNAQRISRGMQIAIDAGLSAQGLMQAGEATPEALDLMKDLENEDLTPEEKQKTWDRLGEVTVQAVTGAVPGVLGLGHALKDAGHAFATNSPALSPSKEAQTLRSLFGDRDVNKDVANKEARDLEKTAYETLGYTPENAFLTTKGEQAKQNKRLAALGQIRTHNDNPELLRQSYNALALGFGRDGDLIPGASAKAAPPAPDATSPTPEAAHAQAIRDKIGINDESILPENIHRMVENSPLRRKAHAGQLKKADVTHIDNLLGVMKDAYETSLKKSYTPAEMKVMDMVDQSLNEDFQKAQTAKMVGQGIDNYLTNYWEKPDEGPAHVLRQEAGLGKFQTNVPMARKRIFDTQVEGWLLGYRSKTMNPVTIASLYRSRLGSTLADRNFMDAVRDKNVRGPDSLPAIVQDGTGHVVDEDGRNPATYVNPNGVKNISIASSVVDSLRKSGMLDHHLASGNITEITPKITPENVGYYIKQVEENLRKTAPKDVGPLMSDHAGPDYTEPKPEGAPTEQLEPVYNRGRYPSGFFPEDLETMRKVNRGELPAEALDEVNSRREPSYAWSPKKHVPLDHPSFRHWKYLTADPSGNEVWIESGFRAHPEFADYIKNRLGISDSESPSHKSPVFKAALRVGGTAKQAILSLSQFHLYQEMLRGVMSAVNPIMQRMDYDLNPATEKGQMLRDGVKGGLTLTPDYKGQSDSLEGVNEHLHALDKVPLLGHYNQWFHNFLFQRYMPALKARAYTESIYPKYRAMHPDWTDEAVHQAAAYHVNNAFGGQNWRAMGRSLSQQEWFKLAALAPDWLESELRYFGQLFGDNSRLTRMQVGKMAMGMWGIARVLNMLNTGNMHLEAPFGLAQRDKDGREVVYGVRTLPSDLLHVTSDPIGFIKGRVNPLIRTGVEAWTGRNQYGEKLTPRDLYQDMLRSNLPISVENIARLTDPASRNVGAAPQLYKGLLGGAAQVYRSQAQKKAAELASARGENGPLDQQAMQRNALVNRFEEDLRAGRMYHSDLQQQVNEGKLTRDEEKRIMDNARTTVGMSPENSRLFRQTKKLNGPDFLSVYDVATPKEQSLLHPLLMKKAAAWRKHTETHMLPEQRLADPTLKRFKDLTTF